MAEPLIFQGSSDDTFGCVGGRGDDHDNCANGKPIVWMITDTTGAMLVWGQYSPKEAAIGSGWVIGVGTVANEEGDELPLPAWPMVLAQGDCPYSPTLTIEAPETAVLSLHYPKAA